MNLPAADECVNGEGALGHRMFADDQHAIGMTLPLKATVDLDGALEMDAAFERDVFADAQNALLMVASQSSYCGGSVVFGR